jgi:hypothetical protein
MKTYRVAFVSKDSSHAVDLFYKYRAEGFPRRARSSMWCASSAAAGFVLA